MRPQLIELTAESRTRSRKRASLNMPFTSACASSNVPSMAIACTFALARGRHLPPLHRRDAAVGEEDGDVDPLAAAERFDRRAAGVARGRADDRRPLVALRQDMIHETGEELHRQVLEGERRPVEELEQEMVRPDLDERRDRVVPEARIGVLDHPAERRSAISPPAKRLMMENATSG